MWYCVYVYIYTVWYCFIFYVIIDKYNTSVYVTVQCTSFYSIYLIFLSHNSSVNKSAVYTDILSVSLFPTSQHRHEWSQRDHRRVCVWRPVCQRHAHHLCDERSATVSGNQSPSQHQRPRHRQDGESGSDALTLLAAQRHVCFSFTSAGRQTDFISEYTAVSIQNFSLYLG